MTVVQEPPLYVDEPPPYCDACRRTVDYVRSSIWHSPHRICKECFYMWYDPDDTGVDLTDAVSIGNAVRKKHGLPPIETDGESAPDPMEYTSVPPRDVKSIKARVVDKGRAEPLPMPDDDADR